jgi:hypothetical protein
LTLFNPLYLYAFKRVRHPLKRYSDIGGADFYRSALAG